MMKCDRCGVESARESFFRVVPRSFSKRTFHLCPSCVVRHGDQEQLLGIWFVLGLAAFAILLAWITPNLNVGPALWNFSLLMVFTFGSTVAHELGHVFVARLAGMHVTGIEIGRGQRVADFQCLGFRWWFRAIPVGGFAFAAPRGGRWVRLRQTAFILGGPLANLLLIGAGLALAGLGNSLRYDFMERFNPGTMLLIANAGFLVSSLVPCKMDTSRGALPTDGLLLWQTWRRPRKEIEALVPYWHALEAQDLLQQRKEAEATVIYVQGLKEYPDDASLQQVRAFALLLDGKAADARRIYVRILGRYSRWEHIRHIMFNNIAWADVLMEDPALLWEADAGSRLALEAQPTVPAFKGTRGAVLVELGDFEAGLRLLHEAMREHEEDRMKAINACFIGIAHSRVGDAEQCRSYFALARRLDPTCVLLKREPS